METQITRDDTQWKDNLSDIKQSFLKMKARAEDAEKKLEALELVASYARDIVDSWPKMTLRTLSQMTNRINALKEALGLVK